MLKANGVSFTVGDKVLLQPTTVAFEANQMHVIMGANGAGKSTLLKILAGSQRPGAGSVTLNGETLENLSAAALARSRGVLSQHYHINFPITVADVVMMGRYPYFKQQPSATDREICWQAMAQMQVTDLAARDYTTLSGGEAQKVMMSRVLAQVWNTGKAGRILFLDEPVSHLDVKYQHQLMQTARSFCAQGQTVVAVLHDINLALHYANRLLFMKRGAVVYDTSPESLHANMLQEVFDIDATVHQSASGRWVSFTPPSFTD